jgi:AcrR family transcriptional regulator
VTAEVQESGATTPTPGYFAEFVEGRRGAILDAALAVFAEKGYEGGTMREVAARLGLTEPALYRHYPGKEALYADLVARAGDRIIEAAGSRMRGIRAETLRSSLVEVLSSRRRKNRGMTGIMPTLLISSQHNPALLEALQSHFGRPMSGLVRSLIPRVDAFFGIERTPEQLDSGVRAYMSLVVGYSLTSIALGVPEDDEATVDAILAVMGWRPEEAGS